MSALWGVSSYEDRHGDRVSYEAGNDEVNRDIAVATEVLGALGVGEGDRVLVCSRLCEAAQWWPFTIAPMLVGAQVSLADATAGDAGRVAMFCRELDYAAVLGVSLDVVRGLRALQLEPIDVFASVGIVGAAPAALPELADAHREIRVMATVGPAVAIATGPGEPMTVPAAEWAVHDEGGHVLVSSVAPRHQRFDRVPTATRGEVVDRAAFRPAISTDASPRAATSKETAKS